MRKVEVRGFIQQALEDEVKIISADYDDDDGDDDDGEIIVHDSGNEIPDPYWDTGDVEVGSDEGLFWVPTTPIARKFDMLEPLRRSDDLKRKTDAAWMPLARFLARLPAVRDYIFDCKNQVPVCVLSALHQNHPKCRLHVSRFWLRSLIQSESDQHDIEPDEMALIKSPCLHSTDVECYDHFDRFRASYNEEAVLEMISGLSPGLKVVRMFMRRRIDALGRKLQWRGFLVVDGKTGQKQEKSQTGPTGQVQVLAIAGDSLYPGQGTAHSQRTDFSQLRTLQLDLQSRIELEETQTLTRIAQVTGFNSLRAVSLSCTCMSVVPWLEAHAMDEALSLFLCCLPPLTVIRLNYLALEQSFNAIVSHHGHTLKRLCFMPAVYWRQPENVTSFTITARHVQSLAQSGANLEDVELASPRTKGDAQEMAIYRSLSQLPRLKRLSLLLEYVPLAKRKTDFFHYFSLPATRTEFERHVRDCLVNAAVDSDLAFAIFRAVSAQARLQKFKVGLHRSCHLPAYINVDEVLRNLIELVRRSWSITRDGTGKTRIISTTRYQSDEWVMDANIFKSPGIQTYLENYLAEARQEFGG